MIYFGIRQSFDSIEQIKERYSALSAAIEPGKRHLPVDSFCKEVVGYLAENNWNGNVILEYMFEFHDRLLSDLEILKTAYKLFTQKDCKRRQTNDF